MKKSEMKTIITFNADSDIVKIHTLQPKIWRKCEKLGFKKILSYADDNYASKAFECSKKNIKIKKLITKTNRVISEIQKQKMRDGLAAFKRNKQEGI